MRWFFLFVFSLIFFLGCIATLKSGPFYFADTLDPDYAYLFNGLNIALGKEPSHVDHPGTTLQSLIASGIFLSSIFYEPGKVHFTIRYAENILLFYNLLFIFTISVLAALIAVEMKKTITSPLVFLLLGACFFNFEVFRAFSRVSPEPVLLICCLAISYLLIRFVNRQENELNIKSHSFWISFWLAAGLITKITFLPLLFFLGLNYGNKEDLKYSLKKFFLVAFIFFLPALGSFKGIMRWFGDILSHTGTYGQGEVGILSAQRLQVATKVLFGQQILFTSLVLLGTFLVLKNRKFLRSYDRKILFAILAAFVLQLLMYIKHPGAGRYLLPSIAIMPLFLYMLFSRLPLHSFFKIIFVILLVLQVYQSYRFGSGFFQKTKDYHQIASHPLADHDALICSYPCSREVFGLQFGNTFAGKHYSANLFEKFPNFLEFSIIPTDDKLYDFNKKTRVLSDLFVTNTAVYVQGPPDAIEPRLPQSPDIEVTEILKNSTEALYMLRKK